MQELKFFLKREICRSINNKAISGQEDAFLPNAIGKKIGFTFYKLEHPKKKSRKCVINE